MAQENPRNAPPQASKVTEAKPQTPTQPQAAGLTEARQTPLAQHWNLTPAEKRPGLLEHFQKYGSPIEREFIEKLARTNR